MATVQKWTHRERAGKGGGREFALGTLPGPARAEIFRRRIQLEASRSLGTLDKPRAPLAAVAEFTHRQAERHTARTVILEAFDELRGARSARQTLDVFVSAYNAQEITVADWARAEEPTISRRTLERWLSARNAGRDEDLAGRWAGGRKSVFEMSPAAADFIVGANATQPLLSNDELLGLLKTNFPQGLPDENGVTLDYPSVSSIARYLAAWHADAGNAQAFLAFTDPDRSKSHHRFAAGVAAANVLRLNQLWEIDASPADVITLTGRKSIYALIDVASRRLMTIVTDTPRTLASLLLIARACQAWGVPEILGTDNGSDFTSKHFRMMVRQLGIHHRIAKPYSPEQKPFVERSIKTIQKKFMPLLPGFIGANVAERTAIRARDAFSQRLGVTDDKAFDQVALGGDELQDRLAAWCENVYGQRPHSGLGGKTPLQMWDELAAVTPARIPDERAIGLLLMPPASHGGVRVVGKKAIKIDGVEYWTNRLIPGQRVQVRMDPADAGKIWIYTDTDPFRFIGIGVNPELAGLDRAELAGRIRAEQRQIETEGRARLRKLVRETDIHSVAQRMIGELKPADAANGPTDQSESGPARDVTPHTTDALDQARLAIASADAVAERTAHLRLVEPAEETHRDRFKRAKDLRDLIADGKEISPASREWLLNYEQSSEFKGLTALDRPGRT